MPPTKTGYVYDDMMTKHKHCSNPQHPEAPERVITAHRMLQESGLLNHCTPIQPRMATKEELLQVHTSKHIADVQAYTSQGKDDVCRIYEQWRTYTCDYTYASAAYSAGCSINIVDAICADEIKNGIAIVRPPGHHAEIEESCGFCFFNNTALCARHALRHSHINKVLIIDWDIHHGNGIQNIFYNDPNVLYISLHRFDNGDYFPSQKNGDHYFTGAGEGEGFNVNIPWNRDIMGNIEYKTAFDRIILPIAHQFKPDLIVVASGFDAAAADIIGEYILTPDMYAYMTHKLKGVTSAKERILLVLEGGYNPRAIGQCFSACLEALLYDKERNVDTTGIPCKRAAQSIRQVIETQSKYWDLQGDKL